MKKALCFILTISILLCTAITASSGYISDKGNKYPVILVEGRAKSGTPIYSEDGEQIYPVTVDPGYLVKAFNETADEFLSGVLTGDYTAWAEAVAGYTKPIFEKLVPDKNGEITDNSGPEMQSGYGNDLWGDSTFDYAFKYDWRYDPCYSADKLNEYIQMIKETHNCDKVSLCPRCYGANVVSAYL